MLEHEESIESEKLKENYEQASFKSNLKKTLTNNEILSQSILFLTAGHETTATTLSFIAYNLAMNRDCQKKLYSEIENALNRHVSL